MSKSAWVSNSADTKTRHGDVLDVGTVDGAQIENHDVASLAGDGAGISVLEPIRRQVWRAESVVSRRDVLNVALLVRPVQESNLSIFVVRVVQVDGRRTRTVMWYRGAYTLIIVNRLFIADCAVVRC